ncbi:MAG TPA: cell division protein FtsL [Usitatibacter sp.]|nr:cell division protein FtsL [Usitatibacter sp.]
MTRLNALLLLLAIACAAGVITSQHRARKVFSELEGAQSAARKLDEEFTQLQLEQSTWATSRRVESVASRQLGMRLPDAQTSTIVTLDSRAAVADARP